MSDDDLWGGEYNYDSPNVYSTPEKCGLELVADIEFSDECYQFDTLIVLRDLKTKRYYSANSSGCSCPQPFEEFRRLGDLDDFNYDSIRALCHEKLSEDWNPYPSAEDVQTFLNKIRRLRQPR